MCTKGTEEENYKFYFLRKLLFLFFHSLRRELRLFFVFPHVLFFQDDNVTHCEISYVVNLFFAQEASVENLCFLENLFCVKCQTESRRL